MIMFGVGVFIKIQIQHLHVPIVNDLNALSRIFPSPSESLNNPFKLSAFVPLVEKCSESPILAIRHG